MAIKGNMKALYYKTPKDFEIREVPIPEINDDEVLLKVTYCGVCGTDLHIHDGEFVAKFPLVPGHEAVGHVVEIGKNVSGFAVGDRAAADVGLSCQNCFYCRRGQPLFCENLEIRGVTHQGGFAEYIKYPQHKLYKFTRMTDEEATLLEPAACAIHGLDKLNAPVGVECLLLGAGPTGLILAQLLKQNGASRVVLAAPPGIKLELAKSLDVADEYIPLDRKEPEAQWERIKKENPYGFDVVVEATGVESLVQKSIDFVRRGGTLMVYGVYSDAARVSWPPSKIFGDEIKIIGSFSQAYCFPRAVAYLDSGKIRTKGMVTDVFSLDQYQDALDKMNSRGAVKVAIKP